MTDTATTEQEILSTLSRDAVFALMLRETPRDGREPDRPLWFELIPFYMLSETLGHSSGEIGILRKALDTALLIPGVEAVAFLQADSRQVARRTRAPSSPTGRGRLRMIPVTFDTPQARLLLIQFSDVTAKETAESLVGQLAAHLAASLRRARTLADLQERVDDVERSTLDTLLRLRESATSLAGWLEILRTAEPTVESPGARRALEQIDREMRELITRLKETTLPEVDPGRD